MWRVLQAAASLKVMGWDPGQKPKWEIHQECIPFLSSPLFFLPLSVFGRTAAAITLLYISSFNLTYNRWAAGLSDSVLHGLWGVKMGSVSVNILNMKAKQQNSPDMHSATRKRGQLPSDRWVNHRHGWKRGNIIMILNGVPSSVSSVECDAFLPWNYGICCSGSTDPCEAWTRWNTVWTSFC